MVRQSQSLILCMNRLLELSSSSTKVSVQISKFRHSCQCLHSRGFLGILYLPDMSGSIIKNHDYKQEYVTSVFPLWSPTAFHLPVLTNLPTQAKLWWICIFSNSTLEVINAEWSIPPKQGRNTHRLLLPHLNNALIALTRYWMGGKKHLVWHL